MVRALHAAGLEVILDVVFNHTAEGFAGEPALSLRGLANEVYYRLDPADPSRYVDTTGTGNSLDTGRPEVLRLVCDSLRWWVAEMHVDGVRFDLAAALARQHGYVDRLAAFFDLVYQDPVLSTVKLIAEPWDVGGPDSYAVGRFPAGWAEWNDTYRDTLRDFWRARGRCGDLATRVAGSSDIYGATRRGPDASVNFVSVHDGMTLADLGSYARKHNEANGEANRDGAPDERSDNHGVEGPTDDPAIRAARGRHRRALLASMLVSQGVPIIGGGDELCRTQGGNNNAYCQDSPLTWYDWTATEETRAMTAFTARAVRLPAGHPALRRRTFLSGTPGGGSLPDITWIGPDGTPMSAAGWADPALSFLGWLLAGDRADLLDRSGVPLPDADVLVLANSGADPVTCRCPDGPVRRGRSNWTVTRTMERRDQPDRSRSARPSPSRHCRLWSPAPRCPNTRAFSSVQRHKNPAVVGTGLHGLVGGGDIVERVTGPNPDAQPAAGGGVGDVTSRAKFGVRGEVVAAEQAQRDVGEQQRPEREGRTLLRRGVGSDHRTLAGHLGIQVGVGRQRDLDDPVHPEGRRGAYLRDRVGPVQRDSLPNHVPRHVRQVGRPAYRADDRRAAPMRQLRRQTADRAEHPVHQHHPAGHRAVCVDRPVRRDARNAKRRTEFVTHRVRQVDGQRVRQDRGLSGGPERTVRLRSIHPHPPANPSRVHTGADRVDDPGPVAVRDDPRIRHHRTEPTPALLDIARVHPRDSQPHPNLPGRWLRQRHNPDLQHLRGRSLPVVPSCSHAHILPVVLSARRHPVGANSRSRQCAAEMSSTAIIGRPAHTPQARARALPHPGRPRSESGARRRALVVSTVGRTVGCGVSWRGCQP
jgi:hypothetical protein